MNELKNQFSRTIEILFATETGNSADVAERLWRRLKYFGLSSKVINLSVYDIRDLGQSKRALFVCPTTGQGECPKDMKKLWKILLRKNLESDTLSCLEFGIVGLGDSSYPKYNVVAKRLQKRLLQLGGKQIIPTAFCDDQHELGYDGAFEPWLQQLLCEVLPNYYRSEELKPLDESVILPPKYRVQFLRSSKVAPIEANEQKVREDSFLAEVKSNCRVTAEDHFQAVHLIKLEIDANVRYKPGDVAVLMPRNDIENVEDFTKLLNASLDEELLLCPTDPLVSTPPNLKMPCTLRHCIEHFWDIQSIPRRSFFDIFWLFSKCETEQEKLKEFTTAEGQEELYSYCNRPRRNILEVLQDFPNTTPHVPIDYYFDLLPPIRPRSFSIASSLSYNPRELHILVAVVKFQTRLLKPRRGLCSTWLSKLTPGCQIPLSLASGSIQLPDNNLPVIMIGPGTGCAPFRGFVQERSKDGYSENYLFFGCRYKEKDFLCQREWQGFVQDGHLKLYTAFSRDQEHKIYVQDKIEEAGKLLWDLIDGKRAYIYIAGNSKNMPNDVRNAILDIICKEGKMERLESERYVQNLETLKKLLIETWS